MTKTTSGLVLVLFAVALTAYNITDTLDDLRTWHDCTTPQFVAVVLRQASSAVLGILGGTLLPQDIGARIAARFTKE